MSRPANRSTTGWCCCARTPRSMSPPSSGTSGTMSFFPRSKQDYWIAAKCIKVQLLQKFGEPVDWAEFEAPRHVAHPVLQRRPQHRRAHPGLFQGAVLQGRRQPAAHRAAVQGQRRPDVARRPGSRRAGQGRRRQGRRARQPAGAQGRVGQAQRRDPGDAGRLHPAADPRARRRAGAGARHHRDVLRDRPRRPGARDARRVRAGIGGDGRRRGQGPGAARRLRADRSAASSASTGSTTATA